MSTLAAADPAAALYRATTSPRLLTVPAMTFLTIDGHGDPNTSPAYADAVQALFGVSYAAKFAIKKVGGADFKVSPLEGLWWAAEMTSFSTGDKAAWDWTMMIRQPDSVTPELVERLAEQLAAAKSLPSALELRLTRFEEGPSAQVLHVGPYATEGPTIARLHDFLRSQGVGFDGFRHQHHEIYLSDPRRAAPDKLRTIIRQAYEQPDR